MSKALITESLLTGIADAIRAKTGETGTMTPAQMATKIGTISGGGGGSDETARSIVNRTITSYSDDEILQVGDSAFNSCTQLTSVELPTATSIGDYAFCGCTQLTSVELPAATSIGDSAFQSCTQLTSVELPAATSIGSSAFYDCSSLTSVELPTATSIGSSAFYDCSSLTSVELPTATSIGSSAFYDCSSLTSVELPTATSIGDYAFCGCTQLTSVELPAVKKLSNMQYAFENTSALKYALFGIETWSDQWGTVSRYTNSTNLSRIDLPNCTSVTVSNAFSQYLPALTEIHFAAANKETIEASTYYSTKWGATNATIYFDLADIVLTISNPQTGATYWLDGAELTADELENGVHLSQINKSHSLMALNPANEEHGIQLYTETITPTSGDAITKTIDFATCTTACGVTVSGVDGGVTPQIVLSYDGTTLLTAAGTSASVNALANTEISYVVTAEGYRKAKGTVTGGTAAVTMEAFTVTTWDMSYPFTDCEAVLANLCDGSNFEISESPTSAASSGTAMSSSIVSGSKSFGKDSGVSYGYIKFHTPSTEDADKLTVSVTCNAYAEGSCDVGAVFIDTSLHQVTSNVRDYGSSYGTVLYSSYSKNSATYGTYTATLQPDTDYYLQFAYTKDGSANQYWDRLSITNIKFTDYGTY